ncbi:MAG: four helix bundle protein [Dehalococcoidia bacterium]|nr:four helix bundle protein [Dehalococcoidia bacterium]
MYKRQIYQVSRGFPDHERNGLTPQLRRAAVSVASNIAEGAGRTSDADFARFLEIAYGSLMEATCQVRLAFELGYTDRDHIETLKEAAAEISRMLSGLRKYRKRSSPGLNLSLPRSGSPTHDCPRSGATGWSATGVAPT